MKEKILKGRNLKRLLSVVLTLAVIFTVLTQGTFVYAASGNTYTITTNGMTWEGVDDAKSAKAGDIINVETTSSHGVRVFLKGGTSGDWADGTKSIDESGTLSLPAIPDGYKVVNIYAGVDMIITIGQDHVHNFTYTLVTTNTKNDTIKAHCSAEEHTGANDVTLTLTASDANYSGSAYTGASLSDTTAWITAGFTVPKIMYVGRESTTYAESETAPSVAGTYTAKVTVEGQTASVNFEIKAVEEKVETPADKPEEKVETPANKPIKETDYSQYGKKKTVKVPEKVVKKGVTYKVTSIKANAFSGEYVEKVELPATITKISANAFKNDNKLVSIKIKSKKLTVSKKAFSGMKKAAKAKVKVTVSKKMSKKDFTALKKNLVKQGLKSKNIVRK